MRDYAAACQPVRMAFHLSGSRMRPTRILDANLLPRFRVLVIASLIIGYAVTPVLGNEPYRKPKIRAITAFVRIDPSEYREQIQKAVTMLR